MACICSQYNAHSLWLILGHYFPIMLLGQLWACTNMTKSHIINNISTLKIRSYQEMSPLWTCLPSFSTRVQDPQCIWSSDLHKSFRYNYFPQTILTNLVINFLVKFSITYLIIHYLISVQLTKKHSLGQL